MERIARRWLNLHAAAWSKVMLAEWNQLLWSWPAGERDELRELIRQTGRAVAGVAWACAEARRTLTNTQRWLA
jgi:hypothetical protein